MKVFEILRNDILPPSEKELVAALKKMNWNYEFADDDFDRKRGEKMMEHLENMVYQSYKIDPEKTLELWKKLCPYAKKLDESVIPDFILRFQAIDESNGSS